MTGQENASFSGVRCEVKSQLGQLGLLVRAHLHATGLAGRQAQVFAGFFFEDGTQLRDANGHYVDQDGFVSLSGDVVIQNSDERREINLFIPIDELHLAPRQHHRLFVDLDLYIDPDGVAPLEPVGETGEADVAYFFKLPTSLQMLTSYSRGLTKDRLRLYFDDFARMLLRVPSEAEQQRIVDCLGSLDARLSAETKKLAAFKAHKKGLMQKLFPSPEEV